MRGFDEAEVREYLDMIADQVQASDRQLAEMRAENERLRIEIQRARMQLAEHEAGGDEVTPQAVALMSQAQLVAEEMVEDVTKQARERMEQARAQEREILDHAHHAAEMARKDAVQLGSGHGDFGPMMPVADVEYVKSFTRVAQAQMQSILDALADQVEKLGAKAPAENDHQSQQGEPAYAAWRSWQVDVSLSDNQDSWRSDPDPWASA